jgi:hypothetical protein
MILVQRRRHFARLLVVVVAIGCYTPNYIDGRETMISVIQNDVGVGGVDDGVDQLDYKS